VKYDETTATTEDLVHPKDLTYKDLVEFVERFQFLNPAGAVTLRQLPSIAGSNPAWVAHIANKVIGRIATPPTQRTPHIYIYLPNGDVEHLGATTHEQAGALAAFQWWKRFPIANIPPKPPEQ